MRGDRLCATGLPITAYGSLMGRARSLLRLHLVGLGEAPDPGEGQDVGLALHFRRELAETALRRQPEYSQRRLVQHLLPGRAPDFRAHQVAVAIDFDIDAQAAVK